LYSRADEWLLPVIISSGSVLRVRNATPANCGGLRAKLAQARLVEVPELVAVERSGFDQHHMFGECATSGKGGPELHFEKA
jgi:hypothetical protein